MPQHQLTDLGTWCQCVWECGEPKKHLARIGIHVKPLLILLGISANEFHVAPFRENSLLWSTSLRAGAKIQKEYSRRMIFEVCYAVLVAKLQVIHERTIGMLHPQHLSHQWLPVRSQWNICLLGHINIARCGPHIRLDTFRIFQIFCHWLPRLYLRSTVERGGWKSLSISQGSQNHSRSSLVATWPSSHLEHLYLYHSEAYALSYLPKYRPWHALTSQTIRPSKGQTLEKRKLDVKVMYCSGCFYFEMPRTCAAQIACDMSCQNLQIHRLGMNIKRQYRWEDQAMWNSWTTSLPQNVLLIFIQFSRHTIHTFGKKQSILAEKHEIQQGLSKKIESIFLYHLPNRPKKNSRDVYTRICRSCKSICFPLIWTSLIVHAFFNFAVHAWSTQALSLEVFWSLQRTFWSAHQGLSPWMCWITVLSSFFYQFLLSWPLSSAHLDFTASRKEHLYKEMPLETQIKTLTNMKPPKNTQKH